MYRHETSGQWHNITLRPSAASRAQAAEKSGHCMAGCVHTLYEEGSNHEVPKSPPFTRLAVSPESAACRAAEGQK